MAFPRAENKGGGELCPAGTHVARAYRLIDLGTQYSERFKTQSRKIILGWELPNVPMSDGRPFAISKWYTLSWHKKANLRKDLQAWRGTPFDGDAAQSFDISKVIGQACLLSVIHDEKDGEKIARVNSIMAMPHGQTCPPAINPVMVFSLNDFDKEAFENLPEKIQEFITNSLEYKSMHSSTQPNPAVVNPPDDFNDAPDDDDGIPWGD